MDRYSHSQAFNWIRESNVVVLNTRPSVRSRIELWYVDPH